MRFNIYLLFIQLFILYNQYEIINGKAMIGHNLRQARSRTFRHLVSIMRIEPGNPQSNGFHFCSGTLITRRDVLTCEHCIDAEQLNAVQMILGTVDLRNGSIHYPFWWQSYDQWATANNITNDTFHLNDVANVRLLEPVKRFAFPIRISALDNTDLFTKTAVMAGWGINNENIIPDILNFASVQIIENDACEARLERITRRRITINSRIFCSFSTPFALLEDGDSGGPLTYQNQLIAINQGTSPITHGTHENKVNVHFGTHFYKTFVNYMKYEC